MQGWSTSREEWRRRSGEAHTGIRHEPWEPSIIEQAGGARNDSEYGRRFGVELWRTECADKRHWENFSDYTENFGSPSSTCNSSFGASPFFQSRVRERTR